MKPTFYNNNTKEKNKQNILKCLKNSTTTTTKKNKKNPKNKSFKPKNLKKLFSKPNIKNNTK